MKKNIVITTLILLCFNVFTVRAQWYSQTSGTTEYLSAIHFLNENTGWIVGSNGTILKTANGGMSWVPHSSGTSNLITGVDLLNENSGWVTVAAAYPNTQGSIQYYDGQNWTTQYTNTGQLANIYALQMLNSSDGWALSGIKAFHFNGSSWIPKTTGSTANLRDLYFTDTNSGWAVGDGGIIIHYNGSGWTTQTSGTSKVLYSVCFVNNNHGWAVGEDGVILFYNGSSWSFQESGTNAHLFAVNFTSINNGWAVGYFGTALHYDGNSWTEVDCGYNSTLNDVYFVNESVGWACADYGTILKHINPQITVTKPEGGDIWYIGGPYMIYWDYQDIQSDVTIELYKDDEFYLTLYSSTPCDGDSWWSPPEGTPLGNNYQIKISTVDGEVFDYSDYFIIDRLDNPYIEVTFPIYGETLYKGIEYNLEWDYQDINGNVKIGLYQNGYFEKVITDETACDGSYFWTPENNLMVSDNYQIKISALSEEAENFSDYFTIDEEQNPYLQITAPANGDVWYKNEEYTITWDYNDINENVKLELFKNSNYIQTISSETSCSGNYTWSIPGNISSSSNYRIKISTLDDTSSDYSDYFTIDDLTQPFIEITSPNNEEVWLVTDQHDIMWNYQDISGPVKIELYNNGNYYNMIVENTPCDGMYTWLPFEELLSDDRYQLKITAINDNVFDVSGFFRIENNLGVYNITTSSGVKLNIVPNPSRGNISISYVLSDKSNVVLSIFDLKGKKIRNFSFNDQIVGKHEFNLNLQDFKKGLYLCRLQTDSKTVSKKFILQ